MVLRISLSLTSLEPVCPNAWHTWDETHFEFGAPHSGSHPPERKDLDFGFSNNRCQLLMHKHWQDLCVPFSGLSGPALERGCSWAGCLSFGQRDRRVGRKTQFNVYGLERCAQTPHSSVAGANRYMSALLFVPPGRCDLHPLNSWWERLRYRINESAAWDAVR